MWIGRFLLDKSLAGKQESPGPAAIGNSLATISQETPLDLFEGDPKVAWRVEYFKIRKA